MKFNSHNTEEKLFYHLETQSIVCDVITFKNSK